MAAMSSIAATGIGALFLILEFGIEYAITVSSKQDNTCAPIRFRGGGTLDDDQGLKTEGNVVVKGLVKKDQEDLIL